MQPLKSNHYMCDGRKTLYTVWSYTAQVSLFNFPYRFTQSGRPFLERINPPAQNCSHKDQILKIKILRSFHPRLASVPSQCPLTFPSMSGFGFSHHAVCCFPVTCDSRRLAAHRLEPCKTALFDAVSA